MISRNISQISKSCWWLDIINDHVYYLSGTPATQSQLAKDVTTFLTWAGEPYYDSKKALEFKVKSEIDLKLLISSDFFFYWSANALNFDFIFTLISWLVDLFSGLYTTRNAVCWILLLLQKNLEFFKTQAGSSKLQQA